MQHRSRYSYESPATLGPHTIRLRPAAHARANIESYGLTVEPAKTVAWQQDPSGNRVARVYFDADQPTRSLEVLVQLAVDVRPVNPFDFLVEDEAKRFPFAYPPSLAADLAPFLPDGAEASREGPRFARLLAEAPRAGDTVAVVVEMNRLVRERIRYVIREEPGIWTPEETLANERGSCRDSAVLLVALLRARGLAARFVSGYLIQLTDEGMIPNEPRGVGRDVVDLHAWAEVFLPGAGWIGLDATSGLLCGEGHIPLACTANPAIASPVDGTSDVAATEVAFSMTVGRLGHEPRPTRPYEESTWEALLAAADHADRALERASITLTTGGEPTFNSREHPEEPEWNGDALGPTKLPQGQRLADELRARLAKGGVTILRTGKSYPGEPLPRWVIDVCGRADGVPMWRDEIPGMTREVSIGAAKRLADALAARLGLAGRVLPALEDPWRHLQDEAALPVDVDPVKAELNDPRERARLARVLDRGLGTDAGYVLPLARIDGAWQTEAWTFRRGHLFLLPGDSAIGLRLPLQSLGKARLPPRAADAYDPGPRDPRRPEEPPQRKEIVAARPKAGWSVRTALCVEPRDGALHVFLPPVETAGDFFALVAALDAAREDAGLDARLEGYPPPPSPEIRRIGLSPDPGVIEVNLPPSRTGREHAALVDVVFDAALHAGLHSEKYLLDGRVAGSGGGHHLTLGGPTPLESPLVVRPDLVASLVTFAQHHPSLSYLFAGLFVGPTSQAPRVDEARSDAVYELEIALERAFDRTRERPPWLSDLLFRHLLVDLTGNTHRAEICLDKLFDPQTAHGRQGLVELRAFEMPPHPRMASAQAFLARALVASFADQPYQAPLVRWGQVLHDRFLLPHWLWKDFEDVLAHLEARGVGLPADAYRPFLELRCPLAGTLAAGDVTLEVRNAIEPWNVLGEELTQAGTSRFVDSSMERIEVRAEGLVPERHAVLVNGRALPLRTTGRAGQAVGGVRFRAWAPPHSLHPHLGIHHPIRLDVVDTWARRSLGACGYHVWHPEGRAFDAQPLTRFEATARRSQRFTLEGPMPWPVVPAPASAHPDAPYTLDLRRYPMDRPPPTPKEETSS